MSKRIKVGLDIRDLRIAKTGAKTYLEEIYKQCKKNNLDCDFVYFDTFIPVYTGDIKLFKLVEHLRYLVWKQLILPILALINGCDMLFCTDYFLPWFTPGCKTAVVFHDSFFYEYPAHYNSAWLKIFRVLAVGAAKKADCVITVTEYAKGRITYYTGIDKDKITVVHLAPKAMAVAHVSKGYRPSFVIPTTKFILHVGTLEKRKNLVRLIEAFKIVHERYPDYSLVLVGQSSTKQYLDGSVEIAAAISSLGLTSSVVMAGYASDDDLSYIYSYADMYVFPSINEGFGMPVLEAFHHRLPVLVANNTSLPEVGGDAVLSFDPFNVQDIQEKIIQVIESPHLKNELIKKGAERLKSFSWEQTAKELVRIFQSAVGEK